jgi:hypothetical protein
MLLKSIAKVHPNWKIISLRYFNPAGNHPSGLIGDNPVGTIPGNLFSIIQEVIIEKRQSLTVFGTDYNTFDGTGVRDFVHVVDLGIITFIQQRDISKPCSILIKWINLITRYLISDQEMDSVFYRLSISFNKFCKKT